MNLSGERLESFFLFGMMRARTSAELRRLRRWYVKAQAARKSRAARREGGAR